MLMPHPLPTVPRLRLSSESLSSSLRASVASIAKSSVRPAPTSMTLLLLVVCLGLMYDSASLPSTFQLVEGSLSTNSAGHILSAPLQVYGNVSVIDSQGVNQNLLLLIQQQSQLLQQQSTLIQSQSQTNQQQDTLIQQQSVSLQQQNQSLQQQTQLIQSLQTQVNTLSLTSPTNVTTLPTSPVDGQEIYYQTSAMSQVGVSWHLRYRASSTSPYKWEYVGGPALYAARLLPNDESATSTTVNFHTTFSDNPQFTLPLAGEYEGSHGLAVYSGSCTTCGTSTYPSFSTTPSFAGPADLQIAAIPSATWGSMNWKVTLTASSTVQVWHEMDGISQSITFRAPWIQMRPIRLG